MNKFISYLISKFKKVDFIISSEISFLYLLNFLIINLIKYMRGILIFRQFNKRILLGKNVVVLAKYKFTFKGKNIHIDRDCYIDALSLNGIILGDNVSLQKKVMIECTGSLSNIGIGLIIGNNTGIGSNSFLGCAGGIEIGNDTIIGNYVTFHSENHNFGEKDIPIRLQGVSRKGIKIGNNCWIGAKVTILDGTVLGNGCIVAAGAVLNGKNYPSNSIIAGIPARIVKNRF